MIALKNVLVPTDFSETSDCALRYGKALADAFGATLHVVHIVEEPYGQPWAVEAYGFSLAALQDEWIQGRPGPPGRQPHRGRNREDEGGDDDGAWASGDGGPPLREGQRHRPDCHGHPRPRPARPRRPGQRRRTRRPQGSVPGPHGSGPGTRLRRIASGAECLASPSRSACASRGGHREYGRAIDVARCSRSMRRISISSGVGGGVRSSYNWRASALGMCVSASARTVTS